jgi:hypothetical protein
MVRVAILPFATSRTGMSQTNTAEQELSSFSNNFVKGQRDLTLKYSYYLPEFDQKLVGSLDSIWNRGVSTSTPRASEIYALRHYLDADVALMYFYKKRGAGRYQDELYSVDVYVFDLERQRMYRDRGDERSFKRATKRTLERLFAAQGGTAQIY